MKKAMFHRRLKQIKLILGISLLTSVLNLLVYTFTIRVSLKTLLARQSLEITRLSQLAEKLEEELRFYKETRFSSEKKLFDQLTLLKKELTNYKGINQVLDQTLAEVEKWLAEEKMVTPSPAVNWQGGVKIKDPKWEKVEVYVEPKASSKIIGTAEYGKFYLFRKKSNNWYEIEFKKDQLGWVQAQFLEELP